MAELGLETKSGLLRLYKLTILTEMKNNTSNYYYKILDLGNMGGGISLAFGTMNTI